MINAQMKKYNYQKYGDLDEYGQPAVSATIGTIKMSINFNTENIDGNALYSSAQYIGLTMTNIDDTYIIEYGNEKLKVLYVNPLGRYKQVFLARV